MSGGQGVQTEDPSTLQERLYNSFHHLVDHAAILANHVLAFLMVMFAVVYVIKTLDGQPLKITQVIANIAICSCGLMILLDRDRSLPTSVGLVAVGLGAYKAFMAMSHYVYHSQINIAILVIVILGFNMMFSGRAYLIGKSRFRSGMILSASLLIVIYITYLVVLYNSTRDFVSVAESNPQVVLFIAMYVIFILVLDSEKLRSRDWLEVHERIMSGICRTHHLDPDAQIERTDAEALVDGFRNGTGWNITSDGGPVVREYHSRIKNRSGLTYLIAQEWSDSDCIHVTLADRESGTILQASRFQVSDMELDGDALRLISPGGNVVQIMVVEEFQWYRCLFARRSI